MRLEILRHSKSNLFTYLSIHLSIFPHHPLIIHLSIHLSIICPFSLLSTHHPSIHQYIDSSFLFSIFPSNHPSNIQPSNSPSTHFLTHSLTLLTHVFTHSLIYWRTMTQMAFVRHSGGGCKDEYALKKLERKTRLTPTLLAHFKTSIMSWQLVNQWWLRGSGSKYKQEPEERGTSVGWAAHTGHLAHYFLHLANWYLRHDPGWTLKFATVFSLDSIHSLICSTNTLWALLYNSSDMVENNRQMFANHLV